MEEHQVVVTEASQKGIWTHGQLYGNRSRYVFSTYYRLGFRLLGLSCVLVQTHHLHRPKAHLRSLCCFKAFAKAEKSECYFNSSKVEAGQWVTGHRHHFPRKSKQRGSHAWKWLTFRMVTLQTSSIKWCQIAEKIGLCSFCKEAASSRPVLHPLSLPKLFKASCLPRKWERLLHLSETRCRY